VNPAQKILAICGDYDSVVYGRALSAIAEVIRSRGVKKNEDCTTHKKWLY